MSCFGQFKKSPLEKLLETVYHDDTKKARDLLDSLFELPGSPAEAERRRRDAQVVQETEEAARKRKNDANNVSIDGYRFVQQLNQEEPDGGGFFAALHVAAFIGSAEMIHLILQRGADVNIRTKRWRFVGTSPFAGYGWYTPLHLAAMRGNASAVCKLIQAGATQGYRTEHGKTALELAFTEEVKQLLSNPEDATRRAREIDASLHLGPEGPNANATNRINVAPNENNQNPNASASQQQNVGKDLAPDNHPRTDTNAG